MPRFLLFGLSLLFAAPMLGSSRPAGAAPPAAWPQGKVTAVTVLTIARDAKGNASEGTDTEASLTKTLMGDDVILTADGAAGLGHINGNSFTPVLVALQFSNSKNTFAILDFLDEDTKPNSKGLDSFHANIARESDTATSGFLQGHLLTVAADGSSSSSDLFLTLTFNASPASTTPPTTTPPSSNPSTPSTPRNPGITP